MATREQIRQAFYSALETAASGLVNPINIGQEYPESDEEYPSIVHDDSYRKVPMNQGSAAPSGQQRDGNGDATAQDFTSVHEAQFSVLVASDDESEKESVYEAVRDYFEKYEHPAWDASDIQSDVKWVRVLDSNSEDDQDRQPIARGDRLDIRLTFIRVKSKSGTAIQNGSIDVDADNDGTGDETFTFSG